MKSLLIALAVLAMLCTVLATLVAVVSCFAMGANGKPDDIRVLKLWMLGLTALGLAGITIGIVLIRAGQPGWAAGVSFAPTVAVGVVTLVALLK